MNNNTDIKVRMAIILIALIGGMVLLWGAQYFHQVEQRRVFVESSPQQQMQHLYDRIVALEQQVQMLSALVYAK